MSLRQKAERQCDAEMRRNKSNDEDENSSRRKLSTEFQEHKKTITKPLILFYRDIVHYKALLSEKCKCERTRANFAKKHREKFRSTEG